MNFYQETPADRQRKEEALDKRIKDEVHKNQSSFKEWLVKPVVVASITALITTSITVPLTILLTNSTNQWLKPSSQAPLDKSVSQKVNLNAHP